MRFYYYFLVRSWNNFAYVDRCLDSLLRQQGEFTILYIDDYSEYTRAQKHYIKQKLKGHRAIFNKERKYSVRNAYEMITSYATKPRSIIVNVDGDDWLNSSRVLPLLDRVYSKTNCQLTYGSCLYWRKDAFSPRGITSLVHSGISQRYPLSIEQANAYRKHYFIPLHLRTWRTDAFMRIRKESFLRPDGSWLQFCEDQAIYFPLLEMSGGAYEVLSDPVYTYNIATPHRDMHRKERLLDEVAILRKHPYLPL